MHIKQKIKVASTAFLEMLTEHSREWNLTPLEQRVLEIGMKGYWPRESATILQMSVEEIETQSASIFAKTGFSGWPDIKAAMFDQLLYGVRVPETNRKVA